MRVLLVIDHLGPGGAQRQMVELACGLEARGHQVEMFIYHAGQDFFRSRLTSETIAVHEYHKGRGFSFGVIRTLVRLMRAGDFDVVLSYLNGANIYAELATLILSRGILVVSERTNYRDDRSRIAAYARRRLHGVADWVVANSFSQRDWLIRKKWLARKVSCIYNGLDLSAYRSSIRFPNSIGELRLAAVGRIGPEKNVVNVVEALGLLYGRLGVVPSVSWIGQADDSASGRRYRRRIEEALERYPAVRARWRWLGRRADIAEVLDAHHALIHASFYEGLPNAICEALASGLPVLASSVCDHPLLVREGQRGFLFDPAEPSSIVRAIERLIGLDAEQWRGLCCNARKFAESELGVEKMVSSYEALFVSLLHSRVRATYASK